jgi:hypothetical protein
LIGRDSSSAKLDQHRGPKIGVVSERAEGGGRGLWLHEGFLMLLEYLIFLFKPYLSCGACRKDTSMNRRLIMRLSRSLVTLKKV